MYFKATTALLGLSLMAAACSQPTSPTDPDTAMIPQRVSATPMQAADPYYKSAEAAVAARAASNDIKPAKNVILFVGDGMGISTITAARIYAGQKRGVDGEGYRLTMETLPNMALSKTYSHDFQVSDSASTATAMVSGVKTNSRTLGLTSAASYSNCASLEGARTESLFVLAERAGLATGLVSTARLTHATPASTYAQTPNRDWEADSDIKSEDGTVPVGGCTDIASQFINWPEGDGFEIALAGGRAPFYTSDQEDPEDEGRKGDRTDDQNLAEAWTAKSNQNAYIWNLKGFNDTNFASDTKVLGLFERSHMEFEMDRPEDISLEPSIADMTKAAITRLSQDPDGYVLLVEGGRIDHAHHGVNAARALDETDAFDQAVAAALEMTNPEETLIIVTADHSHTLTMSGYPVRGNPILGKVNSGLEGGEMNGLDGKPYTTLSYANGQSACRMVDGKPDCIRQDLSEVDTTDKDFNQPSLVPVYSETHAGEDVAIFATGPGSELVAGVMEQNEIFHVMGRASGLVTPSASATE